MSRTKQEKKEDLPQSQVSPDCILRCVLPIIITGGNKDNTTNKNMGQVLGSSTGDNGPPYLDPNSTEDEGKGNEKDEDNAKDEVDDEDDAKGEVEDEDNASISSAPIIVSELPVDIDLNRPDLYSDRTKTWMIVRAVTTPEAT